jgi:hypothetical protein
MDRNQAMVAAAGYAYESAGGLPEFTMTAEQIECSHYAKTMGWIQFYAQIKAMLASLCPWRPEKRVGGEWVPSDDPRMIAMVNHILPASGSQMAMRFRSLKLQSVIGEHAFWPAHTDERGLVFEIASPEQMRRGEHEDTFGVAYRRDARPGMGFGYKEFPLDRLRRHFLPDDTWPLEARVALAPILPEMRIYESLIKNLQRTADSRLLMNGLLWISTKDQDPGDDWVEPQGSANPDDAAPSVNGELAELVSEFSRFGARAFRDHRGNDVASRLPFPFPHHTEPKLIELGRPIDAEALEGLTEIVYAGARGLMIPTQFLVTGEGTANHWGDAELRRALHERAVFTELVPNDEFWTEHAFRPLLASTRSGFGALMDDDPNEWRLAGDRAAIDIKSGTPELWLKAYVAGISDRKFTADKMGIPLEQQLDLAPDMSEYDHWLTSSKLVAAAADPMGAAVEETTAVSVVEEPAEELSAVAADALRLISNR